MEIGTNGQRDIYQRLVLFVDLDRSRGPSLFLLPDGGHSPSQYALDLMDLAPALPAPPCLFISFVGGVVLHFSSTRRYRPLRVQKTGIDLLHDPLFNKGTGYGYGERGRMRLRGLVPPRVLSMDQQMAKLKGQLDAMGDDMQKALFLVDLHDRNETLYHRMLLDHIEEMAPLVYTPTVGRLCSEFGDRYRRPRGMYFTPDDDNNMDQMLHNWPQDDVRVVVVTDGSRILGLGDLGANGMGIPIGKLALYCAAGGVAPHRVLPVTLDFGTNNPALLENPYYLGVQSPRLEGDAYFELLDEFMSAIRYRFPASLVQFEDFSSDKAQFILDRYRNRHLCFNDDIQGTGATTLAGVLSALRVKGLAPEDLHSQRFVILGAGSAGTGVAEQLKQGMMAQGLSEAEARARFYLVDEHGLLSASRGDALQPAQATFARTETDLEGMGLVETIKHAKPHVLLGLSSVGGLFTEEVVREMAAINERPIVFPLSNPTANAECTASDAFAWSDGRVIFASGSPFDPVIHGGKTYEISQVREWESGGACVRACVRAFVRACGWRRDRGTLSVTCGDYAALSTDGSTRRRFAYVAIIVLPVVLETVSLLCVLPAA